MRRHLNIYPDRNQFTYHRSEHSSQVSPSDKHTVVVQEKLHRRPECALAETWPTWYMWEQGGEDGGSSGTLVDCYVTCQIPIPSIGLLCKHQSFLYCPSLWPETWPVCRLRCISSRGSHCRRHAGIITYRHKTGWEKVWNCLTRAQMRLRWIFQTADTTQKCLLIVWTGWILQSPAFCHIPFWISSSIIYISSSRHSLCLVRYGERMHGSNKCVDNHKIVSCWSIYCPSQLRNETIYQHKLLVYHVFVIWQLCLELVEDASLSETPPLYNNTKSVAGNIACPLILHVILLCCYCSCLFPFGGWSVMALWKMGLIIQCAVWAIMWAPTGFGPITKIHKQHTVSLQWNIRAV